MKTTTLAIETSCDDTSIGLVARDGNRFDVKELLSFSQIDIHQDYGGVVPELAYRSHADKIIRLLEELGGDTLQEEVDLLSVTSHPGLPGALQVGVTTAHTLATVREKPVVEVNHIMGHVFSVVLERELAPDRTPYVCLTVSGGHNDIYLVEQQGETEQHAVANDETRHKHDHLGVGETISVGPFMVTKIGQTIDDAAGEAFDKVARMLGGPYPGWARIGQQAKKGGPNEQIDLNATFLDADELLFSFSGLKSQVHYLLQELEEQGDELTEQLIADIAWRFQEEVSHVLAKKLAIAAEQYEAQLVGLVGGVSANMRLRERAREYLAKHLQSTIPFYIPEKLVYCTDNAAMIGAVGLLDYTV